MSSSRFSLGVSHGGGNRHVPDYGGEVAFDLVVGQTILENLVLLLPPILPMSCLAWATSHSSHFSFSSVNFVNGGMPLAFVPPPGTSGAALEPQQRALFAGFEAVAFELLA